MSGLFAGWLLLGWLVDWSLCLYALVAFAVNIHGQEAGHGSSLVSKQIATLSISEAVKREEEESVDGNRMWRRNFTNEIASINVVIF